MSERIGTNRYYYLFDGLGSVVALVNSSGTVVNTYKYDPYGRVVSTTGTVANPWRYVGAYLDTETGMYKMGARYYDPSIQRFTQMDPKTGSISSPLSLNRYNYASCNPVNATDRSGLSVIGVICGGVVGTITDWLSLAPTGINFGKVVTGGVAERQG